MANVDLLSGHQSTTIPVSWTVSLRMQSQYIANPLVITWAGLNTFDDHNESQANQVRFDAVRVRNDNYDIRYSFRSIYKYMPWFNRIFLVVSNRTYHDILDKKTFVQNFDRRLVVVNLLDLYCAADQCAALTNNTNSESIETVLHRIPDLNEYYVYFNDDFMIGRPLHWSFFFARVSSDHLIPRMSYILYKTYRECSINWYEKWKGENMFKNTYHCTEGVFDGLSDIEKRARIPYSNLNGKMRHWWDHMPRPYVKQYWVDFEDEYPEWFKLVRSHRYFLATKIRFFNLYLIARLLSS